MPPKPIAAGKSSFDLIDFTALLSAMNLGDDVVLLDAACGAGRYAVEIARRVRSVRKAYAFDLWEEGIDHLRLEAGSNPFHKLQWLRKPSLNSPQVSGIGSRIIRLVPDFSSSISSH